MHCFHCQSCDVFDIYETYSCAVMWTYILELILLALSLCQTEMSSLSCNPRPHFPGGEMRYVALICMMQVPQVMLN